jgi:hypothetical protein
MHRLSEDEKLNKTQDKSIKIICNFMVESIKK